MRPPVPRVCLGTGHWSSRDRGLDHFVCAQRADAKREAQFQVAARKRDLGHQLADTLTNFQGRGVIAAG
jgi:hypothetical protein